MAKGLHGKPPGRQSSGVNGVLLLVALVIIVATVIGAAHGLRDLVSGLPWAKH